MDRKESYLQLLKEKFGSELTSALLDSQKFRLIRGDEDVAYDRVPSSCPKEVILKLIPDKFKSTIEKYEHWSFDFPSWVGDLNFKQEHAREIMVVGMEPHIRKRIYQATYGLRETDDNVYGELDEGGNKRLWRNINALFGDREDYKHRDFLSRFYITDMCHIALRTNAKKTQQIYTWQNIRADIAQSFLVTEIELINPKFIISQGGAVAHFIHHQVLQKKWKHIGSITPDHFNPLNLPVKNTPAFDKYELNGSKTIHVRLPHIASGQTNNFWIPAEKHFEERQRRIDFIKRELMAFYNQP